MGKAEGLAYLEAAQRALDAQRRIDVALRGRIDAALEMPEPLAGSIARLYIGAGDEQPSAKAWANTLRDIGRDWDRRGDRTTPGASFDMAYHPALEGMANFLHGVPEVTDEIVRATAHATIRIASSEAFLHIGITEFDQIRSELGKQYNAETAPLDLQTEWMRSGVALRYEIERVVAFPGGSARLPGAITQGMIDLAANVAAELNDPPLQADSLDLCRENLSLLLSVMQGDESLDARVGVKPEDLDLKGFYYDEDFAREMREQVVLIEHEADHARDEEKAREVFANEPRAFREKLVFHYLNGSVSYDAAKETQEAGHIRSAREAANAETIGRECGWTLQTESSGEVYAWQGNTFDVVSPSRLRAYKEEDLSQGYNVALVDDEENVLASLGGVTFANDDPSNAYSRVLYAELAQEAISEGRHKDYEQENEREGEALGVGE